MTEQVDNKKEGCKHEWGTYKNGRNCLHCADCGIELDMITRQPIKKGGD